MSTEAPTRYASRPAKKRIKTIAAALLSDAGTINEAHSRCTSGSCSTCGSTNADAINAMHTRAACFADGCDDAVWLLDRCKRGSLRG